MASFCPTNTTTYSLTDYQNAAYPGGLVELISPSADRDSNTNLLTDEACSIVYKTLVINDTKIFAANITREYCYFNGLYASAVQNYMSIIGNASANQEHVNIYSGVTITLMGNLIDISTVVRYIGTQRQNDPAIQSLSNQMQQSLQTLQSQLGMLTSSAKNASLSANTQLYKEMEKYSRQKAQYTNNLLGFYSFLNITALGLLFYIYRSM